MTESEIFEKHRKDYCAGFVKIDFESICDILGGIIDGNRMAIPFYGKRYYASKKGIVDENGGEPGYMTFVVLSKYILLAPGQRHHDPEWVSFKDFKRLSPFVNANYFTSDTEKAISSHFSGKRDALAKAGGSLGGFARSTQGNYDLTMQFEALPRISLSLCFNDRDEEFPAQCSVLFQRHSEFYLDPESLAMTGALLAKKLKKAS